MPMVSVRAFAPLMTQRVTISPFLAYDDYGNATYSDGVVYQCALVGDVKLVRTPQGQEVPSRQAAYLMSNAVVRPEDQITLSTGDAGSTESYAIHPPILTVSRYPFVNGQFATVVFL